MSVHEHKQHKTSVKCLVVTISDTRTKETDKSGQIMEDFLHEAGHEVVERVIIKDERHLITAMVRKGCHDDNIDAILFNGGTGISNRDVTIETIRPLFEKEITGFGELFRMLSYTEDIGSAAMMTRAAAGVRDHTAIFSTPGSSGAVKLAMEKLIIPELSHVIYEISKDR